jgi:hypothetical protein
MYGTEHRGDLLVVSRGDIGQQHGQTDELDEGRDPKRPGSGL